MGRISGPVAFFFLSFLFFFKDGLITLRQARASSLKGRKTHTFPPRTRLLI